MCPQEGVLDLPTDGFWLRSSRTKGFSSRRDILRCWKTRWCTAVLQPRLSFKCWEFCQLWEVNSLVLMVKITNSTNSDWRLCICVRKKFYLLLSGGHLFTSRVGHFLTKWTILHAVDRQSHSTPINHWRAPSTALNHRHPVNPNAIPRTDIASSVHFPARATQFSAAIFIFLFFRLGNAIPLRA